MSCNLNDNTWVFVVKTRFPSSYRFRKDFKVPKRVKIGTLMIWEIRTKIYVTSFDLMFSEGSPYQDGSVDILRSSIGPSVQELRNILTIPIILTIPTVTTILMIMMMMIGPGAEGWTGRSSRCSTSPRKSLNCRQCQTSSLLSWVWSSSFWSLS